MVRSRTIYKNAWESVSSQKKKKRERERKIIIPSPRGNAFEGFNSSRNTTNTLQMVRVTIVIKRKSENN